MQSLLFWCFSPGVLVRRAGTPATAHSWRSHPYGAQRSGRAKETRLRLSAPPPAGGCETADSTKTVDWSLDRDRGLSPDSWPVKHTDDLGRSRRRWTCALTSGWPLSAVRMVPLGGGEICVCEPERRRRVDAFRGPGSMGLFQPICHARHNIPGPRGCLRLLRGNHCKEHIVRAPSHQLSAFSYQ